MLQSSYAFWVIAALGAAVLALVIGLWVSKTLANRQPLTTDKTANRRTDQDGRPPREEER